MKLLRHVLPGLAALLLAPALYAANPCVTGGAPFMRDGTGAGGTGVQPGYADGTGQGGTGIAPWQKPDGDGDGSGTGGTGLTVEVEGVITGFASICVNGLELHYLPATPVSIHGKTGSLADLAVGQVVHALARGQGDQLTVQQVHIRHLLIAQVEGLSAGKLQALGRTISLNPDTRMPSGLAPGIKVAVSGFVGAHGHAVATRLDVMPGNTPDSLTGEVQRNAQGKLMIDGVALDGLDSTLNPGDLVRAEGRYAQGRMQVTRFEREERAMPADRVVIQGLVRHADKSAVNIGGQRFLIDSHTRIKQSAPRAGEWATVDAVREGHRLRAHEVESQAHPDSRPDKSMRRNSDKNHEPEARQSGGETDRPDRAVEKTERPESVERSEKVERPESPEKTERPEKVERPETPEKTERPEKVERPETPEKTERPEKVERPETPEKTEKPERVERPETPELHY